MYVEYMYNVSGATPLSLYVISIYTYIYRCVHIRIWMFRDVESYKNTSMHTQNTPVYTHKL